MGLRSGEMLATHLFGLNLVGFSRTTAVLLSPYELVRHLEQRSHCYCS